MRRFWPLLLFITIFVLIWLLPQMKRHHQASPTPQRIICLAPSITESAFALGLDKQIIAVTDFCRYPPQACSLPKVGGYIDPNLEKIVALHPDLVILLQTDSRLRAKLNQLGLATLNVDNTTLQGIRDSIAKIGKASGHQKQARQLLAKMQHAIDSVTKKVAGLPRPQVMVSIAHRTNTSQLDKVYIAGQHDFYNDLIRLAGGRNVYRGHHIKVPSLSTEGIVKLNPDIIIDVFPESGNHHVNHQRVMQQWYNLPQINAVKQKHIYIIDKPYGSIPGPRVILLLKQMARIIHPELNWNTENVSD